MGESSAIEWTDATFNPWWGCTRVSAACRFCYAETTAKFRGQRVWGASSPRRKMADANWAGPVKWDRDAEAAGRPRLVFCASMADVFEEHDGPMVDHRGNELPGESVDRERARLWDLIAATPYLRWLLLTKRPENIRRFVPPVWLVDGVPPNVWMGVTAEDQATADERIPYLLDLDVVVRFVSYEPALGPVDFGPYLPGIDWVIAGGESMAGDRTRPPHPAWFRVVRDLCAERGVPFLFKQWGEWAPAGAWPGPDHHVLHDGRLFAPGERTPDDHVPAAMHRWGKKAAGRLLDGVTHDGFPPEAER